MKFKIQLRTKLVSNFRQTYSQVRWKAAATEEVGVSADLCNSLQLNTQVGRKTYKVCKRFHICLLDVAVLQNIYTHKRRSTPPHPPPPPPPHPPPPLPLRIWFWASPGTANVGSFFSTTKKVRVYRSGDSSVVRAPDSWLKGRGFESLQKRRSRNVFLQDQLS